MNNRFRCFIFLLLISFMIFIKSNYTHVQDFNESELNGEVLEENNYFKITYSGEAKYYYVIYNKEKKIVKEEEQYGTIPVITYIDENTIQILISGGVNTFFCTYYNINDDKFSKQYESPVAIKYGKVAYFVYSEYPYKFVVSDIFDKDLLFKEFDLDVSFAVSPITKAEFVDEYTLYIVYMSGEEYKEKTVILDLNK